jgi:hypothetical protein
VYKAGVKKSSKIIQKKSGGHDMAAYSGQFRHDHSYVFSAFRRLYAQYFSQRQCVPEVIIMEDR